MPKKLLAFIVLNFVFSFAIAQWTVETVPNPKNFGTGYVSNPDSILSRQAVDSLNKIIAQADNQGLIQIAVVVLNSIGDRVPRDFGIELFNYWGIGDKDKNNGLLILLVLDQRRVEFITGYGTEIFLPDAECYLIQQNYMIPYLQEDDFDTALLEGVTETIEEAKENTQISYSDENLQFIDFLPVLKNIRVQKSLEKKRKIRKTITLLIIFVGFLLVIYLIVLAYGIYQKDKYKSYKVLNFFTHPLVLVFGAIPYLFIYPLTKFLLNYWRNMPRISPKGFKMRKLSEEDEDAYLTKGQIVEEKIRSIDYDVWYADESGEILILDYHKRFSKYDKCPKCGYKTYYQVYDRVVVRPTSYSSGKGERKFKCANCGYVKVSTYVIPRKTSSSSSSSGYYSGGFSSYSGGSSGSSSFGSSSWGGGSTGGGGAGSSW